MSNIIIKVRKLKCDVWICVFGGCSLNLILGIKKTAVTTLGGSLWRKEFRKGCNSSINLY